MACSGSSQDNATCPCTLFVPRRSKEMKCKTCGHRHTSHTVASIPPPVVEHADSSKASNNKYVNRLFKSLGATAVHEAARKETVGGFRPMSTGDVCCVFYSISIPLTVSTTTVHLKKVEEQGGHQKTGILPCPFPEQNKWVSQIWQDYLLPLRRPGMFLLEITRNL